MQDTGPIARRPTTAQRPRTSFGPPTRSSIEDELWCKRAAPDEGAYNRFKKALARRQYAINNIVAAVTAEFWDGLERLRAFGVVPAV